MAEKGPSFAGDKEGGNKLTKFPKTKFVSGKPYGHGGFGNVISGRVEDKMVIVKILHSPITQDKFSVFEDMSKLQHKSLVRFLGLFDQEPNDCPQLIYKHANHGNLLNYLRNSRGPLDQKTLNKFTCDIINGMEYLHKMNFVHGCLAARNILLDEYMDNRTSGNNAYINAKISDYGMTRVINGIGANYVKVDSKTERTLPIRWMPREAIIGSYGSPGEVTLVSDVWSFAVVLWEIWTRGGTPYEMTVGNPEVLQNILDGKSPLTFHNPVNCPENVLAVMKNIFNTAEKPDERPTFLDLQKSFESLTGGRPQPNQQPRQGQQNHQGSSERNNDKGAHGGIPNLSKDKNEKGKKPNPQDKQTKDKSNAGGSSGRNTSRTRERSVPRNRTNRQQENNSGDPPPPYSPPMTPLTAQTPLGMSQQMGVPMPAVYHTAVDPRYLYQQPLMASGSGGMGYPYAPHAVGPTGIGAGGSHGQLAEAERIANLEKQLRELRLTQQVENLGRQLEGIQQQQQNINPQANRGRNNPQQREKHNQVRREGGQVRGQQGGHGAQNRDQQGGGQGRGHHQRGGRADGVEDQSQQADGRRRGPRRSQSGQQDKQEKDEGCLNQ